MNAHRSHLSHSSHCSHLSIGSLCLLAVCIFLCGTAGAIDRKPRTLLEPEYVEKTESIAEGDGASRLALATWCRDRGLIREMLNEIAILLDDDPTNGAARHLLAQKAGGDGWIAAGAPLALLATPEPAFGQNAARRTRLIDSGRKKTFTAGKKSFRFRFWHDLDGERYQEYSRLLNVYYDRLKGYFQIAKTELGIDVLIFSKRSDYLDYYNRSSGKSGENTGGFFTYGDSFSLLCFYDDRHDSDAVFNTARHECTHLLVKHCLRGADLATWFEEGLACYFACDGAERSGGYAADCIVTVLLDRHRGKTITLDDLMTTTRDRIAFRHYATAWSWIDYLRSRPETKSKFGKLLKRLRQRAQEKEEGWEEATNHFFRTLFGHPRELQAGWEAYADGELEPRTGEQCVLCASAAVARASARSTSRTGLKGEEKRWLLHRGEEWLARAEAEGGSGVAERCRLERIAAILARARCSVYDEQEMTSAAVEIVRRLDPFLLDGENAALAFEAGAVAHSALISLWIVGKYDEDDETVACDFDALIARREEELERKATEKGELELAKRAARQELEMVRLQRKAAADLAALARRAFALALARTPDHAPAARSWLLLGLGFAPENLDGAFRNILFQVQLDPDDVNLAALAAAYAAMGKKDYAWSLLERAKSISPNERALSLFARYVE